MNTQIAPIRKSEKKTISQKNPKYGKKKYYIFVEIHQFVLFFDH